MDNETSGIKDIQYKTLKEYLKKSLDKRFKGSPIFTANYFLLAFPFPYNIKLALPYLKGFFKTAIKLLIKYKK